MIDALNHLNLAWLYIAAVAAGAIGAGIGWLANRRNNNARKED
ncbi:MULTISPECIES: hypothetical protein [unclassified Streptomyces]|nr:MULTISPECIES: hypothetical protein [unclassified Streptomyces]